MVIINSNCFNIYDEDLLEIVLHGKLELFFNLYAIHAIYFNPLLLVESSSIGNPLNDFLQPGNVVFVLIGGMLTCIDIK